jgi:UDP-N-acetylmuramoyl-tripeptide--D-alanyl-D-alanine ligase
MMTLRAAAEAMHGTLEGTDRAFDAVATDSRAMTAGALFFANKGERFDAVQFVPAALAAGAAAAVVPAGAALAAAGPLIRVDDTRKALGRLAHAWRIRFDLPVVGITGSNGKTTVKDMVAAVLRTDCEHPEAVLATEGNLNNDIGMPLTLLRLRDHHRYAVVEMGMNHAGEIRYLTGLARPGVALVTNAGTAHIGMLGSREAIAHAKGEIYEGLAADGCAVINADDAYAGLWRAQNAQRRVLDFALTAPAAITGTYAGHALESEIEIATPDGATRFRLQAPGEHNARNAVAAAATVYALGVGPAQIGAGLAAFRPPKGRMQRHAGAHGAVLIDDTYNANPESTLAAIAVLARLPGRRVLVLGDMGELGEETGDAHTRVGAAARAGGIDRLYTLGEAAAAAASAFGGPARHFRRIEDLLPALEPELEAGTTVLVKGSRFMQMERVVQSFKATPA